MKHLFFLISLILLVFSSFAQNRFDQFVEVHVKGEMMTVEDDDLTVNNFILPDGSVISLTKQIRPASVAKVCTIDDLKGCYHGLFKALETRGTINSWNYLKLNGYLTITANCTVEIPAKGSSELQTRGIYFNKALYIINIIYDSKNVKSAKKLFKSVRINDQKKTIKQFDDC